MYSSGRKGDNLRRSFRQKEKDHTEIMADESFEESLDSCYLEMNLCKHGDL